MCHNDQGSTKTDGECLSLCLQEVTGVPFPGLWSLYVGGADWIGIVEKELCANGFRFVWGCRPSDHLYVIAFVKSETMGGHAIVLRCGKTYYDPEPIKGIVRVAELETVFHTLAVI